MFLLLVTLKIYNFYIIKFEFKGYLIIVRYPRMKFSATTINKFPGYACIQVKAEENASRQPVHLCVVLDTSASMESESKLENVRQSMKYLIDFLGPKDKLSIVTFSQVARIVINGVSTTNEEKENIRTRISLIRPESNTNLSGGIIAAQDCLSSESGFKQGVLILTDGHANVGVTGPKDIVKLSTNLSRLFTGTSISTIGYGTDHTVELLQDISSEGGGSYYVVNDMEDVAQVFGDILGGLLSCVAQQVTVQLPLGCEIKTRYAVHNVANKVEVVIGDMPAGMVAAFIAKLDKNTAVNIKGYDLVTNENMILLGNVDENDDEVIQAECEAHYLRFVVLELIEKARKVLTGADKNITDIINDIHKYSMEIVNYKAKNVNGLWDMLLEELKECGESLENFKNGGYGVYDSQTSAKVMGQRTTFLGRMKGVAAKGATPRLARQVACGLSQGIPEPPTLSRGFSNFAQRQISSQLQTQTVGGLSQTAGSLSQTADGLSQTHTSCVSQPFSASTAPVIIQPITLPPPSSFLERQIGRCQSNGSNDIIDPLQRLERQ